MRWQHLTSKLAKTHCRRCNAEISASAQICGACGLPNPGRSLRTGFHSAAKSMIDATPAAGFIRRVLGKQTIFVKRNRLAARYLEGSGIEFGALNCPLDLPPNVKVRYADVQSPDELIQQFSTQYTEIITPEIVTNIETMDCVDDCSVDFVVANEVLEHVENPLLAFRTIHRVLRSGGVAFISLPDKRFTFDRKRPITSLEHLKRDYEQGPDWSRAAHYDDFVSGALGLQGTERHDKAAAFLASRTNIHFHVWDYDTMVEMFRYSASKFDLSIVHTEPNRSEGICIFRKQTVNCL